MTRDNPRPFMNKKAAQMRAIVETTDDPDELFAIIDELTRYRTTRAAKTALAEARLARDRLEELGESPDFETLPLAVTAAPDLSGNRRYQDEAIEVGLKWLGQRRSVQIQLPTGSGKTRVGVDIALRSGGPVLWIAPGWELLRQAAGEAMVRRPEARLRGYPEHGELCTIPTKLPDERVVRFKPLGRRDADICFTTPDSAATRMEELLERLRPAAVIWDECHHGLNGKHANRIRAAIKNGSIPTVGMSATPKEGSEKHLGPVGYAKDLASLEAEGFVARAVHHAVETHFRWEPRSNLGGDGDFSAASIRELARDSRRNTIIADALAGRRAKTLVFACDIEHADELLRLLRARRPGQVDVVHSDRTGKENTAALDSLRNGGISILVGVAKLSQGIDVRDLDTVALTRPTTSDILYAQMVGRGSRVTPTKKSYTILEFTDNVAEHHAKLYQPGRLYVGGVAGKRSNAPSPGAARTAVDSEPVPAKRTHPVEADEPGVLTRREVLAAIGRALPGGKPISEGEGTTFRVGNLHVVRVRFYKAHAVARIRVREGSALEKQLRRRGWESDMTADDWFTHRWEVRTPDDLVALASDIQIEWSE